jgi:hypothetical protein
LLNEHERRLHGAGAIDEQDLFGRRRRRRRERLLEPALAFA